MKAIGDFAQARSDEEQVLAWRVECMTRAGISEKAADKMARWGADYDHVIKLFRRGCTEEQLLRIFRED